MGNLPFDLPPRRKRKRRTRRPASDRTAAAPTAQGSLFKAPDVQRCGFCGQTVTVLEAVAACPGCGAIVTRIERRHDED